MGGRTVFFRLRQTEKERSVTVINVLAETEIVDSWGPVATFHGVKKYSSLRQSISLTQEWGEV